MERQISGAVMVVRWQVGRSNTGLITAKCCGEGKDTGPGGDAVSWGAVRDQVKSVQVSHLSETARLMVLTVRGRHNDMLH